MDNRKKVAIVILGWNGRPFLERFLSSVVAYSAAPWCEVVVADNASTDDSVEYVSKNFPNVRVIRNETNEGFAAGYNRALKQVHADYFVLLNQDVEVKAGWLEPVLAVMEQNEQVAAAQPKIKDYNRRNYFEYAGACGGYLDVLGYAFCRGRIFDTVEEDVGQYDTIEEIFWATGACMFIRSDVFFEAGGFDESFFAHQEEIDLCWRIRNTGRKIVCVPGSVVYHVGGGSLPQGNPRKVYLNFRNSLMMMMKNLPIAEVWWKIFLLRLPLDGVAAVYSVWKRKDLKEVVAILKAHGSFYAALPDLLKKRKNIPGKSSSVLSPVVILWQYYIRGRIKFSEINPPPSNRPA